MPNEPTGANELVDKIIAEDNQQGSEAAYRLLQESFTEYAQGGHTTEETKAYWEAVTQELEERNELPRLSIAWANSDGQEFDTDKDGYQYSELASVYGPNSRATVLDQAMAAQLADSFSALRGVSMDKPLLGLVGGAEPDLITTRDLSFAQARQDAQRLSGQLTTGTPALFDVLDSYGGLLGIGRGDGKIGQADLEGYMADALKFGKLTNPDASGVFSAENIAMIQYLQENWGSDTVSRLKAGYGEPEVGEIQANWSLLHITRESLEDAVNMAQPLETALEAEAVEEPLPPGAAGEIHRNEAGLIDQITYDNSKVRSFGYDADGNLNSITNPDGKTYTLTNGTWIGEDGKPALFKNVSIDQETGDVSYELNDGSGVTGVFSPDGTQRLVTHDENGADISKNDMGQVTDIAYANGNSRHFAYDDDGKLKSFTDESGTTYTTTDGTTFVSSTGTILTNVSVDSKGIFHATRDGRAYMIGTDGVPEVDDNPPEPEPAEGELTESQKREVEAKVLAQLIEDSEAQPGDCYIWIAARLLGKPGANDTDPAVAALYKELMALNGNKPLHPGDEILTAEILAQIKNPDFKAYVDSLREEETKKLLLATPPYGQV